VLSASTSPPDHEQPPSRVVSLSPALTATLFDLDLGHVLIGISADSRIPASISSVNPTHIDLQAAGLDAQLEALHPDQIIIAEWPRSSGSSPDFGTAPVWQVTPTDVRAAIDLLWDVVRLFERPQAGIRISALETTLEWTQMASYSQAQLPTCCLLGSVTNGGNLWLSPEGGSYTSDLLAVCGSKNVFVAEKASGGEDSDKTLGNRNLLIDLDQIRTAKPDTILVGIDLENPSSDDVPAELREVSDAQIHAVDIATLTWPGTRLARALQDLSPLLHPVQPV